MTRVGKAGSLLLGTVLMAGCSDGTVPTAALESPALGESSVLTSVVCDVTGDAAFHLNSGPGSKKKAPVWQDITRAEISKSGGTFVLTMALAGPLPAAPPEAAGGLGWYEWGWALDTDPTTFPAGDPFPPPSAQAAPFDFFVALIWDGSAFQAIVVDRRPLLTNGQVVVTPVDYAINGEKLRLSVPSALLGDAAEFTWAGFTEIRHSHWGSQGFENPDATAFVTWPGQTLCP
jgi:hypothetical protein